MDILKKFSVIEHASIDESNDLFSMFLSNDESILLSFKNIRDRVVFTSKKIIVYDVQGLTGKKKEYKMFPYSKISSFSFETSGFLDVDSDLNFWVSGLGKFQIKFYKKINIREVGKLLADKI